MLVRYLTFERKAVSQTPLVLIGSGGVVTDESRTVGDVNSSHVTETVQKSGEDMFSIDK